MAVVVRKPQAAEKPETPDVLDVLVDLPADTVPRIGQLTRVTLAGLKYLILHGDSDAVRLQAIRTILDLPPVKTRMDQMVKTMDERHGRRIKGKKLDAATLDAGTADQVLEMLETD